MSDTVIVGGGVIGLTTAYELAAQGVSVTVLERQRVGQEASWAGAGMLPPGQCHGPDPVRELSRKSSPLWPILSNGLRDVTGIDNGYRNCGSLQISLDHSQDFTDSVKLWKAEGVPVEVLDNAGLQAHEPSLGNKFNSGYRLPTMSQVRNPHHLQALKAACGSLSVQFHENTPVDEFEVVDREVKAVVSHGKKFYADQFIITAGAWSGQLVQQLNLKIDVTPVRGQIVLMKLQEPFIAHILEDGPRYLVPRDDGHLLIGSTQEEVGFVKENTPEGVQGLIDFATQIVPKLREAEIVKTWSGLRPRAERGYPFIGRVEQYNNLILAAGHFRDGLSQSPMTAKLIKELVLQEPPSIELGELSNCDC